MGWTMRPLSKKDTTADTMNARDTIGPKRNPKATTKKAQLSITSAGGSGVDERTYLSTCTHHTRRTCSSVGDTRPHAWAPGTLQLVRPRRNQGSIQALLHPA